MWDKVKETILYIRSKGYRVDGIGWQAHIGLSASNKAILENTDEELRKLSDLIDWAHKNNLEFHITEQVNFIKKVRLMLTNFFLYLRGNKSILYFD